MRSTILNFIYVITSCFIVGQAIASPLGSSCSSFDDCDGLLTCTGGLCSELSTTETCSWAPYGIGYACSNNDDCSDHIICGPNSVCVDPNAENKPPYVVHLGCWNHKFWTSVPEGCPHGNCTGGWASIRMLEINGEHFNTGNVKVQVLSGPSILYSESVSAVAGISGKAAGSFDVKTYIECPKPHQGLGVKVTDGCTDEVVKLGYPTE